MANPSVATIQQQIADVVDLLEETRKFGHVNAKNVLAMLDVIVQGQEGDYAPEALDNAQGYRSGYAALMGQGQINALLDPLLLQMAKAINSPATTSQPIIADLIRFMQANTQTVQSRAFTFAPMSPDPGNVGGGTIHRLVVDQYARQVENATPEKKKAVCIADQNSGTHRHEELFRFEGDAANRDVIEIIGSGKVLDIAAASARASTQFISNPSFHSFAGDVGAITGITGWTPGAAIGNFGIDQTNYYRTYVGETPPASLLVKASDTLTQPLTANFQPQIPIFCQVAYNAEINAATGTLILKVGSNSKSVAFTGQTGWNILALDFDENLWFPNWNVDNATIELEVTGKGGGDLLVDDVVLVYWSPFDGVWHVVMAGGSADPFLGEDRFDWTDSEVGAKIQTFFWRGYGAYLPHSGAPTWVDPT